MKNIALLFVLAFININLSAQIQITAEDMPYVDTFCVSITNLTSFDPNLTGEIYDWDYSFLEYQTQRFDTFTTVFSTPYAYQVAYNNPLDPAHKADIAQYTGGNFNLQVIDITENYDYYKNDNNYLKVGSGSTINSVPTVMKYDETEKIYPAFPLAYQSTSHSISVAGTNIPTIGYYGQTIIHDNIVDGYGKIKTPYGQFDAVRVKSTVNIRDTIYYDSYSIGFGFDRPEKIEYIWIGKYQGIPLLKISSTVTGYTAEYKDSVRTGTLSPVVLNNISAVLLYPNITKSDFTISINSFTITDVLINIVDINGNVIPLRKEQLNIGLNTYSFNLNTAKFHKGFYLISIIAENNVYIKKLVLE